MWRRDAGYTGRRMLKMEEKRKAKVEVDGYGEERYAGGWCVRRRCRGERFWEQSIDREEANTSAEIVSSLN